MDHWTLDSLTRVLQASISPVALVSGVGLLILSMTNRFGRVTDRLRSLTADRRSCPGPNQKLDYEITMFYRRARILRLSISYASGCVLLASIVILIVFVMAVLKVRFYLLVLSLFALSLILLIVSLVLFLRDMHLSLLAVQEELPEECRGEPKPDAR